MCIYLNREFFGRQLDVVDVVVVLYIFVVIVFEFRLRVRVSLLRLYV